MGATVTAFLMIYMFWFIIPVSRQAYLKEIASVNTTSTTMQQILPFTNNWWVIFPLLIAVAGGWTIWSYATSRGAFDY